MNNIKQLIENQREFYNTRVTQDINYRIKSLEKLEYVIKKYIPEIESALNYDLKKTSYESYLMEIGFVLDELSKAQKNIYKWCKKNGSFHQNCSFLPFVTRVLIRTVMF